MLTSHYTISSPLFIWLIYCMTVYSVDSVYYTLGLVWTSPPNWVSENVMTWFEFFRSVGSGWWDHNRLWRNGGGRHSSRRCSSRKLPELHLQKARPRGVWARPRRASGRARVQVRRETVRRDVKTLRRAPRRHVSGKQAQSGKFARIKGLRGEHESEHIKVQQERSRVSTTASSDRSSHRPAGTRSSDRVSRSVSPLGLFYCLLV